VLAHCSVFRVHSPSNVKSQMPKKHDIVQVKNPRSGNYVKIDRTAGKILDHKKSSGAYKNVPVARKSSKNR
jgi:hypothetical protein